MKNEEEQSRISDQAKRAEDLVETEVEKCVEKASRARGEVSSKSGHLLRWPSKGPDRTRLNVALGVVTISVGAGLIPPPNGVDPYARINLMILGLVIASWIVGFCSTVSARFWASLFGVTSLILWYLGIHFSSSGVLRALGDMVTFW